jgi:hypothetical protein
MKKVCLLALAAMLVVALPVIMWSYVPVVPPVYAQNGISITLSDPGNDGINFGNVNPGSEEVGDVLQEDGVPAVTVTIESETTGFVDIGISGNVTYGNIALSNWFYSTQFDKSDITPLTGSYVEVYADKEATDTCDFYHWITVPAGTPAGNHTANVSYKAIVAGGSF